MILQARSWCYSGLRFTKSATVAAETSPYRCYRPRVGIADAKAAVFVRSFLILPLTPLVLVLYFGGLAARSPNELSAK